MGEEGSDEWYVYNAIKVFEQLGWKWKVEPYVKLIHPQGRANFATCGVVFIDIPWSGFPGALVRLCALFPGQNMPLHHHRKRAEVFKIVAGTVRMHWDNPEPGSIVVPPGEKVSSEVDKNHGVSTDGEGGLYVGVVAESHLRDVYWKDQKTLVDPDKCVIYPTLNSPACPLVIGWDKFIPLEPLEDSLRDAWQFSQKLNVKY